MAASGEAGATFYTRVSARNPEYELHRVFRGLGSPLLFGWGSLTPLILLLQTLKKIRKRPLMVYRIIRTWHGRTYAQRS